MAVNPWDEFSVDLNEKTAPIPGFKAPGKADPWEEFTNPNYEPPKKVKIDEKADKATEALHNTNIEKFMRNWLPGHKQMEDVISPSLTKGTFYGPLTPQTRALTDFEENNPGTAATLRATGDVGSTLPIVAGAASKSGPGFIRQWAGQTGATGATNLTNKALEKGKNINQKDIINALAMAGVTSTLPATMTGALGQSARTIPFMTQAEEYATRDAYARYAQSHLASGRTPMSFETFRNMTSISRGGGSSLPGQRRLERPGSARESSAIPGSGAALTDLGGAALGYHLGGAPGILEGALAGHFVGHPLMEMLGRTQAGQFLNAGARNATTQDIVRMLANQTSRKTQGDLDLGSTVSDLVK